MFTENIASLTHVFRDWSDVDQKRANSLPKAHIAFPCNDSSVLNRKSLENNRNNESCCKLNDLYCTLKYLRRIGVLAACILNMC